MLADILSINGTLFRVIPEYETGYKNVLNIIYNAVRTKEKATVLDIGFGTETLTKKLYDDAYSIYGIDYSDRMEQKAREKMPLAKLFK